MARFELLRKRLAPAAASKATPLLVIAPSAVLEHLTEITCKVYSYTSSPLRLRGCLNTDFNDRNHPANIWLRTNSIITNLESVPVHHCHEAFAAVLEVDSPQEGVEEGSNNGNRIRSTIKLVYSGDTRPCDRLIQKGRNADLLIHEVSVVDGPLPLETLNSKSLSQATFEDDLEEDALQKRHSTISEALTVAARMKAAATVLTHFSQRYPNVPEGVVKFSGSAKVGLSDSMILVLARCGSCSTSLHLPCTAPILPGFGLVDYWNVQAEFQPHERHSRQASSQSE